MKILAVLLFLSVICVTGCVSEDGSVGGFFSPIPVPWAPPIPVPFEILK